MRSRRRPLEKSRADACQHFREGAGRARFGVPAAPPKTSIPVACGRATAKRPSKCTQCQPPKRRRKSSRLKRGQAPNSVKSRTVCILSARCHCRLYNPAVPCHRHRVHNQQPATVPTTVVLPVVTSCFTTSLHPPLLRLCSKNTAGVAQGSRFEGCAPALVRKTWQGEPCAAGPHCGSGSLVTQSGGFARSCQRVRWLLVC